MSAFLLGRGFKADMGTCIRKLVLLKLIDACEDDGSRIFPAMATVARAAQCSARQVQREIRAMVEIGLLRLVREGGKGRRSTNEYAIDLAVLDAIAERGWAAIAEGVEAKGDTQSPLDEAAKGDSEDTLRVTPETPKGDNGSHPTPPDSSKYPSERAPGRAREGIDRQDREDRQLESGESGRRTRQALERRFWKMARGHPQSAGMPKAGWLAAWMKLSPEKQDRAEARYPAWLALLKRQGKDHFPALSTYFGQELFEEVPDEAAGDAPSALDAPAFGPTWQAVRLKLLLGPARAAPPLTAFQRHMVERGEADEADIRREQRQRSGWPGVNAMHERAARGQGTTAPPALASLGGLMEAVPVGSERFEDWRAEHARRGWPWLPNTGRQQVVYFPKGGPDGLTAFEAALAAGDQGTEQGEDDDGSGDGGRHAAE